MARSLFQSNHLIVLNGANRTDAKFYIFATLCTAELLLILSLNPS